ncbi:MAG: hypothetical protein LC130_28545 [Bryobacterales bacterium]|nr:hypothetical protein [Bryobacterales bacterium]
MTNNEVQLDLPAIRKRARKEWEAEIKAHRTFAEKVSETVPFWLPIIALVFFLLSLPHTASTFAKVTPILGYVAPAGIEFGLLYTSFYRRTSGRDWLVLFFEVFLLGVSIVVNFIGSLENVVRSAGAAFEGMPVTDLLAQLPDLPAPYQAALIMVPAAALIIPIGTIVTGEGLAKMVNERRIKGDPLSQRWAVEGPAVEFTAIKDAAMMGGMTEGKAHRFAESAVRQIGQARGQTVQIGQVSNSGQTGQPVAQNGQFSGQGGQPSGKTGGQIGGQYDGQAVQTSGQNGQAAGQTSGKNGQAQLANLPGSTASERVQNYLMANPEAANLSSRKLAELLNVSKSTVNNVLNDWPQLAISSNGNGH